MRVTCKGRRAKKNIFFAFLPSRSTRVSRSPRFRLWSPKIRKSSRLHYMCRLMGSRGCSSEILKRTREIPRYCFWAWRKILFFSLLTYFFPLNTLKGTTKAPAANLLRLYTLRGTKSAVFNHKWYDAPCQFFSWKISSPSRPIPPLHKDSCLARLSVWTLDEKKKHFT